MIGISKNCVNEVTIIGTISENFEFDHEAYGKKYFHSYICAERNSKYVDRILMVVPEDLIDENEDYVGKRVFAIGHYLSHGYYDENRKYHVKYYFAANQFDISSKTNDWNEIILKGYVCKKIVKERISAGLTILKLAINREHGCDYLHCLFWGDNSRMAASLEIGDMVEVFGRIQSRDYIKKTDNGQEIRTAYEISVAEILEVEERHIERHQN